MGNGNQMPLRIKRLAGSSSVVSPTDYLDGPTPNSSTAVVDGNVHKRAFTSAEIPQI